MEEQEENLPRILWKENKISNPKWMKMRISLIIIVNFVKLISILSTNEASLLIRLQKQLEYFSRKLLGRAARNYYSNNFNIFIILFWDVTSKERKLMYFILRKIFKADWRMSSHLFLKIIDKHEKKRRIKISRKTM